MKGSGVSPQEMLSENVDFAPEIGIIISENNFLKFGFRRENNIMLWKIIQGKTGFIDTPQALIPTYQLSDHEIIMFDSGVQPHPELLDDLEARNLKVRAVFCSHLHPDHMGNNAVLVECFGAEIFTTVPEREFYESWAELPYPTTFIGDEASVTVDGVELKILYTPGHSPGHLVYITPDGVCYVGDVLMSSQVLQWSKLPYTQDAVRAIFSMEAIRNTGYPYYVMAHKGVVTLEEMPALVDENIRKELALYYLLRQQIPGPKRIKEVLHDFILATGVQEQSLNKFTVLHAAKVRLDALIRAGEYHVKDGMVIPELVRV